MELRPVTYSFSNILKIKDVRRLILATVFRQMSSTMCYILDLRGMEPLSLKSYDFFIIGGALSYIQIALTSECIFGRRKTFYPLFVYVITLLVYESILLVVSLFIEIKDNIWVELWQGFIDQSTTFYFLFLAPIMIAYQHRATQLVTPTATIMTVNITVSNLIDYIFTGIIVGIVDSLTDNDTIKRIPPIIALVISFLILRPCAMQEYEMWK